jgi:hypothetical protein
MGDGETLQALERLDASIEDDEDGSDDVVTPPASGEAPQPDVNA